MESFEERKSIYLEKLNERQDVLHSLLNNKDNYGKKEFIAMMDPKNDSELFVAERLLIFFSDVFDLYRSEREFGLSDCKTNLLDYVVKIINALKVNDSNTLDDIKNELKSDINPELSARYFYDLISVFSGTNFYDFIEKNCGLDLFNDPLNFQVYVQSAFNIINESLDDQTFNSIDFDSESELEYFDRYVTSFDNLYKDSLEEENKDIKVLKKDKNNE